MSFSIKQKARKCPGDQFVTNLIKSPAIMVSGNFKMFSPSNPNEFCVRLKKLLQEKQAGNNSEILTRKFLL